MNNQKILNQVGDARAAAGHLTDHGVEIRRIYVASDQERTVIVCVARRSSDRAWQSCHGCRLVWLHEDVADARDELAEEDESRLMDARFGYACDTHACLHCGCTDLHACRHADGSPCFWIQPGLCSVCAESFGVDVEAHRAFGAEADIHHAITGVARGELPR